VGPILAIVLATGLSAGAPPVEPSCLSHDIDSASAEEFVAEALTVLRSCGHEPSAYRLELHEDDPFVAATDDREPQRTVVFRPIDNQQLYGVVVSVEHPCVVSWAWQPDEFTDWQRQVIGRAEALAKESGRTWSDGQLLDVVVTESRELVGVEVFDSESPDDSRSANFRVLMRKDNLSVTTPISETPSSTAP